MDRVQAVHQGAFVVRSRLAKLIQHVHTFNMFKWLNGHTVSTLDVMPERPTDPNRPYAPYMRVMDALIADIKAGKHKPGEPIPSEAELCERHGVARGTARRAVRVLRERGLVVTEWGKGTHVAEPGENQHSE